MRYVFRPFNLHIHFNFLYQIAKCSTIIYNYSVKWVGLPVDSDLRLQLVFKIKYENHLAEKWNYVTSSVGALRKSKILCAFYVKKYRTLFCFWFSQDDVSLLSAFFEENVRAAHAACVVCIFDNLSSQIDLYMLHQSIKDTGICEINEIHIPR